MIDSTNIVHCKICNKELNNIKSLTNHITRHHKISCKEYYDTYFKSTNEGICKNCGKPTAFLGLAGEKSYREYCCHKCACVEGSRGEKIKKTNLKRYGVTCTLAAKETKEKSKQTKRLKYNNENYCNSAKIIAKFNEKTLKKYQESVKDATILQYFNKEFDCICNICKKSFKISESLAYLRHFRYNTPLCIYCNSINVKSSNAENEIYEFIKQYAADAKQHNRSILSNNLELDICIPSKNLAIEYDGLYWHNELNKENDYHVNKTNECERHDIQLVHIFEDEWLYKQDIVKSRLKGLLGVNNKIFARKCEVKQVSYAESIKFLDENHIQGSCVSTYRYGLYYNDELVSLMTFGKSRFANEYELLRFCNKLYTNVVGGASRLFAHFKKDHAEIEEIVSYADRRWSKGNLYEKLGFEKISVTKPSYYYVVNGLRENRINYQKHKLVKQGYDASKSEHEIMLDREIYRIYDCGTIKYMHK